MKVMATRLSQFQSDFGALTLADIQAAIDFKGWLTSYANYVMSGGDRPPHKPATA